MFCKYCGSVDDFRIERGKGPHAAQLKCNGCDRHMKWISKSELINLKNLNKMGLEKSNHAVFLSISDGKICKAVKQPTQDSITRTNKNGKVVHEEFFDGIKGMITDIFTKDHAEFGKKWVVRLEDEGIVYQLEFSYSSGYSQAFLKTLPNVDLTSPVKLSPKLSMEGDKKKTTLFVNQHGVALKHFYTKDNPNGIPELQKIKVKGKQTYDDSDIMQFLEDMVKNEILPKIKKAPVTADIAAGDDNDEAPF